MKQLHPSNCLGIRSFADAQGCVDLLNVAHNYTMVGRRTEPDHIYMLGGLNYSFCYKELNSQSGSLLHEYTKPAAAMKALTITSIRMQFNHSYMYFRMKGTAHQSE